MSYGKRKVDQARSRQVAEELSNTLSDTPSTSRADWLLLAKLLLKLIFMLLNPFYWRNLCVNSYRVWLRRNKRYQKVIDIWKKRTTTTNFGEVQKQLELTDCYIQLGEYTNASNCLKGLEVVVDGADRSGDWKRAKKQKIEFYRKTIHGLAKLQRTK